MKLSIITINYNDAAGLKKTLESVAMQKPCDCEVEHIVVDGGSTDDSVDVIKEYVQRTEDRGLRTEEIGLMCEVKWISEKDKGVYNAMNKGIKMATGEYMQILNSGDILANDHVIKNMYKRIEEEGLRNKEIIYGNMLKAMPDGKLVRDNCGGPGVGNSFLYFYRGTLNHDCAWLKRELFERFGLYDEDMRICSDWKWYVTAIAVGLRNEEKGLRIPPLKPEQIQYVDIDVTIFDMNGISESGGKNRDLIQKERRGYLEQILPTSVLNDYDMYSFPILQYHRLKKHHLWGLVNFVERVMFKLEKWKVLKK